MPRRHLWQRRPLSMMKRSTLGILWRALLCLQVAANGGCSYETARPSHDAGLDASLDGTTVWGNVELQIQEAQLPGVGMRAARSVISGKLYDGPIPNSMPLHVAMHMGSCQLLKPSLPFCTPACAQDRVCVASNTCQAYPKTKNAGELSVLGLASPVILPAVPPSFAYQSSELAYPPCNEGSEVTLLAMGQTALNRCVAPLTMARNDALPVRLGQPLRLAWNAPSLPHLSRIQIRLDIAHHGGNKTGEILCDVDDTGTFDVPAPLIDALINLGLAGAPSVIVSRTSSVPLPSHPSVGFVVSSRVERAVDTGVITCFDNAACPEDQICDRQRIICINK